MVKSATWRDTPFAHRFYHSRAWLKVRELVLDRSDHLCERCLENGELTPADVVHHKVPLNARNVNDPSVSLSVENLMALCHDCHAHVHREIGIGAMNGKKTEEPRVRFDENGNVVRLDG